MSAFNTLAPMPLRRRQKLIEGEPSLLSRTRREAEGAEDSTDPAAEEAVDDRPEAVPGSGESAEEMSGGHAELPTQEPPVGGDAGALGAEEGLVSKARPIEPRSDEQVRAQLDRLAEQIHGLQEQLDAFIARRSEAVSETASQQVAAIVAAAEESAAEIRSSAEKDAAAARDRLLADVQAEVERIRAEAQADAGRIRTEAHAEAARVREQAITEASAEIQAVCARLSEELQTAARTAIAGIAGGARVTFATPAEPAPKNSEPPPGGGEPAPMPEQRIAGEVEEAVDELQTAAAVLEQSLRHLRAIGGEEPPTG
jgi:vacuolar-type H+-ATPase subunit E/Vma4